VYFEPTSSFTQTMVIEDLALIPCGECRFAIRM
jgi:hypothetical protein